MLRQLPSTVIAAVDTCHSGGVAGARGLRPSLAYNNALRELGSTEVGVVTLSSCQPNELSLEREDWGHGAFSRALLDGLAGQADLNKDGSVTLVEFEAYVLDRVKALTQGRQHPSLQRAPTIPGDLVLAAVK